MTIADRAFLGMVAHQAALVLEQGVQLLAGVLEVQTVMVTVPPGVRAGSVVTAEIPGRGGAKVTVTAPQSSAPGRQICEQVPAGS